MSEDPPVSTAPADGRRRRLLQGLAALVAAGAVPPGFAQGAPMSANAFGALSRTLTGFAWQDAVAADATLRALSTAVGAPTLAKVADLAARTPPAGLDAALASAGLDKVAAAIVVALYSGVVETAKGPVVLTYLSALAWQAVPWTKPNAVCGGMTDYWATAPEQTP